MLIFQFTLPREERRQVQAQPLTLQNFNPRSHERSDSVWNSALYYIQKFQSTLPREERLVSSSFVTVSIYFNPRSHERSDSVAQGTLHPHKDFNPRSHERSDCQLLLQAQIQFLFQSTLPREERQGLANRQGNTGGDFNPRSHERSDHCRIKSSLRRHYFNPRSHERSDISSLGAPPTIVISIHAPTRGATTGQNFNVKFSVISIHAPTRGATFTVEIRL